MGLGGEPCPRRLATQWYRYPIERYPARRLHERESKLYWFGEHSKQWRVSSGSGFGPIHLSARRRSHGLPKSGGVRLTRAWNIWESQARICKAAWAEEC